MYIRCILFSLLALLPQLTWSAAEPEQHSASVSISSPYTTGFTPISQQSSKELSALTFSLLEQGSSWLVGAVNSYPDKFMNSLPSIKKVYPTGEKPLVVINLKCPVEVITGETLGLPNTMRILLNEVLDQVGKTNLLSFDVQLVCT